MLGAFLLQIILITLNAVFASAEIAVISLNETKLKQEAKNGDVRAERLMSLTKQPARFLATIQVAITLAGLLGSAFAADNFSAPLVAALTAAGVPVSPKVLKNVALVVITLILSYFSLVFGELGSKANRHEKIRGTVTWNVRNVVCGCENICTTGSPFDSIY